MNSVAPALVLGLCASAAVAQQGSRFEVPPDRSAAAQNLPRFDDSIGFKVIDSLDADRLVVQNGPGFFVCLLGSGDGGYYALRDCTPIVAARQMRQPQALSEAEFVSQLERLSRGAMAVILRDTFLDVNCTAVFRRSQQATFETRLAQTAASAFGYEGPLNRTTERRVAELASPVLDGMIQRGQVDYSETTGVARLTKCRR